jgi:hypothetical protein
VATRDSFAVPVDCELTGQKRLGHGRLRGDCGGGGQPRWAQRAAMHFR